MRLWTFLITLLSAFETIRTTTFETTLRKAWSEGWKTKNLTQMSSRRGHTMSLWKNKIWILGGEGLDSQYDRIRYNDVWSADVSTSHLPTFRLELESAPWSARAYHQTVSFTQSNKNKSLWLFGGAAPSCTNFPCGDVWSSQDAVNWKKHPVVDTRWEGRYAHSAVAYGGMVFVFGGIGTGKTNAPNCSCLCLSWVGP